MTALCCLRHSEIWSLCCLCAEGAGLTTAQNGCGFLASVLLFPTWVWAAQASLLKPSVVCARSGRCAGMCSPCKQGWWLQSSVWKRSSRSLYGKWMYGAETIRADPLISALCFFYNSVFWLFKIWIEMHANWQEIAFTWMELEHDQQQVGI